MLRVGRYVVKRADAADEFEQIHRLNHRTFVEEIPQHTAARDRRLVDKFHAKSTYFVALLEGRVIGMLSVHDRPPFSVADRLSDPSILSAPKRRPLEVRLLAIEPAHRTGPVLAGLLFSALEHARGRYSDVYISGVAERVDMYRRLGFRPLGPPVADGAATFVPMRVTLPLEPNVEELARRWCMRLARPSNTSDEHKSRRPDRNARPLPRAHELPVCLLPGPVAVSPRVRAAFRERPISHRSPAFIGRFERVRSSLAALAGARDVALIAGSGTLANETIAATLAAEVDAAPRGRAGEVPARGIILANGEFGCRLVRQAARFGLSPRALHWRWGDPWNLDEIAAALDAEPPGSWIWGVHLESSTGVLNDLPALLQLARPRGVRVCVDCVSSTGAVPLDLSGVYLASGTSGKSLGAYAGVAMVFADARSLRRIDRGRVPTYLDLPAMLSAIGPGFTFPSPPLAALEAALRDYAGGLAAARYARYAKLGAYVRRRLRELKIAPLAPESDACGVLTTFAPPQGLTARAMVERAAQWGFAIAGESQYLARRRLVQIAAMGATSRQEVAAFLDSLGALVLDRSS
jgi:aspartate aminotransferase-like enzyme